MEKKSGFTHYLDLVNGRYNLSCWEDDDTPKIFPTYEEALIDLIVETRDICNAILDGDAPKSFYSYVQDSHVGYVEIDGDDFILWSEDRSDVLEEGKVYNER
jgi:hypothetical protein